MKKTITAILLAMMLVIMTGCGSSSHPEFLTASEYWYFYDETTGEYEKMSFAEDGSFYWGCECGEPVGYSDLLELYEYDDESQTITLFNGYDSTSMELKVLDHSEYHLLLAVDGEIKDYTYLNSELDIENAEKYLKDYNMYARTIEGDNDTVVLGPFNYDGDVNYPENAMKSYVLADDIEFFELMITRTVTDDQETCDVKYEKLSKSDGMQYLNDGFAFIWFNDNMEIVKMMFYGEIENQM